MTQSKIQELIAQERGKLEDALALAVERRDVANREIKRLREELDAAPRLHVRRTRKAPASESESARVDALGDSRELAFDSAEDTL